MDRHSNITANIKVSRSYANAWEMRDNAETRKLSADERQLVAAAVQRHNDRLTRGNWRPVQTRTDYLHILEGQVSAVVYPLVEKLYRTNVSGDTYITVKIGAPHASGYTSNNWDVYSKATRYPGHDARITINVMHGWRRHVNAVAGLATAGGMLTTHAQQVAPDAWAATWITQGRGVDLNIVQGYIVRDGDEWAHAATLAAAQRTLKTRRTAKERTAKAAAIASMSTEDLIAQYGVLVVTVADSTRAGNCQVGTVNFIERYFPGRTTATVAELLATGAMTPFVRRAIAAAVARQR